MQNSYESDSEDELPSGWKEKSTVDGNVYYVNDYTNKIQWVHPVTGKKKIIPKELPFGWTKSEEDGKVLYIHGETGNVTSIDPRLAFAKEEKKHANDFRQRFDASSTAYQVLHGIDLSVKYALITGSNAGIGYETAKSLARHHCNVIFANRNMEATTEAIQRIVKETNVSENNLTAVHLDLSSLESVKKCALEVRSKYEHLDMLILNAGVFGLPYTETQDHLESTFQVNHLSHMYLALLLEPLLKRGSRVVFVSSESHRFASLKNAFVQQNLSMKKDDYFAMMAYNNSKLLNVTTAKTLGPWGTGALRVFKIISELLVEATRDQRAGSYLGQRISIAIQRGNASSILGTLPSGSDLDKVLSKEWASKGILVNSLHPGNMVYSNLSKSWWLFRLAFLLVRPFTKSMQQAAATTVYVATAEDLDGVTGLYFNNCYYCEESALARDSDIAKSVFEISLKMIEERMGNEYIEKFVNKWLSSSS